MTAQPTTVTRHQRSAFERGQTFLVEVDGELAPVLNNDWSALINPNVPAKICRTCGRIVSVTCFQSAGHFRGGSTPDSRSPDCVICVSLADEAYRREHMWEHRAEAVLRHHMRTERTQGLHGCRTLEGYCRLIGIPIDWLARKMRLAWENDECCDHCETAGWPSRWRVIVPDPYADPRQLARMTVDRTDRTRLLARDNLTLMCLPGNIAKGKTDASTYNDRQAYWRLHNHAGGDASGGR